MDFDTYQKEAGRTAKWLGSIPQDLMHASLGLEQRDSMLFGLAEMPQYLEQFLAHRSFGFEAAMEANIEKLRKQSPDRYTDEAPEARADKGGLDACHS